MRRFLDGFEIYSKSPPKSSLSSYNKGLVDMTRSESYLVYFNLTDMFIKYKQCLDMDQGYWIQFKRILYLKIKGVDLLVKGKADQLVLVPKWCLAWEGRSEFYELSY